MRPVSSFELIACIARFIRDCPLTGNPVRLRRRGKPLCGKGAFRLFMKVCIGLQEIAGYYINLANGFKAHGIDAQVVNLTANRFQYALSDNPFPFVRAHTRLAAYAAGASRLGNFACRFLMLLIRVPIFIWALTKFDVFIFSYGETFFRLLDLPVLGMFRKKLIFVFHGSDARPPYLCGFLSDRARNVSDRAYLKEVRAQKTKLKTIEKYADAVVSAPTYSHFFENPFILSLIVGLPNSANAESPDDDDDGNSKGSVRILHAPTDPLAKGTESIRKVVEDLRKKHAIEYREITGQPHRTVLKELQRCDLVIDQIYSDTPLAGLANEAAMFGKPSVVGGYPAMDDFGLGDSDTPRSEYCHPDKVADSVERLIADLPYRRQLGKKSREFVLERWKDTEVARRFITILNDQIPADWWYDPHQIRYRHGAGMPEERVKKEIRRVISSGGIAALQLADKPELEKSITEFAEET